MRSKRSIVARCAFVATCLASVVSVPTSAATLTATSSTLLSVFNGASGGDTITLVGSFGSVYLQNRSFSKVVTLDASHAQFSATMTLDNVGQVAFNGGTFNIASDGPYAKGVAVYGGGNIYFDAVTVNGSGDGAIDQFGIAISGTHNAQVTHSKFIGLYSGIAVGGATGGFLAVNTFTGSTSDGIDISDSHGTSAIANKCSGGNPRPGAHPDCIQLWSVAGHSLESDITVTYNTAIGATAGFTDFDQGLRINFSNNIVNASYPAGIACYDCVDSKITNNTLSTLPGSAYQTQVILYRGSGNAVSGNVVAPYIEPRPNGMSLDDPFSGGAGPAFASDALGAGLSHDAPAAVPEPSSWALLIAGFAAVGVARRRVVSAGRTA